MKTACLATYTLIAARAAQRTPAAVTCPRVRNALTRFPFQTNSFLYTPLLPQVTVGTVNARSIAQPTRQTTRFKSREVQVLEAEATKIDTANKTVSFEDKLEVYGKANGAVVTSECIWCAPLV